MPSHIVSQSFSFGTYVQSQLQIRPPFNVDHPPCRSDSVYMVPPFLAYYGVTTGNQSMLLEAYTQVCLYIPLSLSSHIACLESDD